MGNTRSSHFENNSAESWWPNENESEATTSSFFQEDKDQPLQEKQQKMEEVRLNIAELAQRRRQIVEEKSKEIEKLKLEIEQLRKENKKLKNNSENERSFCKNTCVDDNIRTNPEVLNDTLETKIKISENEQIFEKEKQEYKSLIAAQKEVILVYKQMLKLKETQLSEVGTFFLCTKFEILFE